MKSHNSINNQRLSTSRPTLKNSLIKSAKNTFLIVGIGSMILLFLIMLIVEILRKNFKNCEYSSYAYLSSQYEDIYRYFIFSASGMLVAMPLLVSSILGTYQLCSNKPQFRDLRDNEVNESYDSCRIEDQTCNISNINTSLNRTVESSEVYEDIGGSYVAMNTQGMIPSGASYSNLDLQSIEHNIEPKRVYNNSSFDSSDSTYEKNLLFAFPSVAPCRTSFTLPSAATCSAPEAERNLVKTFGSADIYLEPKIKKNPIYSTQQVRNDKENFEQDRLAIQMTDLNTDTNTREIQSFYI